MNQLDMAVQEAIESVEKAVKVKRVRKPKTSAPETEAASTSIDSSPETTPIESDAAPIEEPKAKAKAKKPKATKAPKPHSKEPKAKKPKASKPKAAKPKAAKPKASKPKAERKPSTGKGTPAQKRAASTRQDRRDWIVEIEKFRKASANNMRVELGSPGSAQVTRVRLTQWEGFDGLVAFTKGANLFISKLKLEDAKAAARKAGKL